VRFGKTVARRASIEARNGQAHPLSVADDSMGRANPFRSGAGIKPCVATQFEGVADTYREPSGQRRPRCIAAGSTDRPNTPSGPSNYSDGVVLPHQTAEFGALLAEDGGCWWAISIATRTR
jgi:hypothetical protein